MLTFNVPCRQFFSHTCNVAESGFVHPPNRIPDKIPKNIHRVSVFSRMISQGCLATEPHISPFLFLAIFVYHGRNWALTLGICRNWVSCYSVWAAEMFSKWDSDPLLTYIQAENYPISRMLIYSSICWQLWSNWTSTSPSWKCNKFPILKSSFHFFLTQLKAWHRSLK